MLQLNRKYIPTHPKALEHVVSAIADEQEQLFQRLSAVGQELQDAKGRLETDTAAAQGSLATLAEVQGTVTSTAGTSDATAQSITDLQQSEQSISDRVAGMLQSVSVVNETLDGVSNNLGGSTEIRGADMRADDDMNTLAVLHPHLTELETGINSLEQRIMHGDLDKMVETTVGHSLDIAFTDPGRSISRILHSHHHQRPLPSHEATNI